ncbi:MAG TPA: outer membrane protein transport protein [Thermoanaerobaculia bacterium]|nr:outer membrane protein transport protein [Thermoanaerobaculia bacterium]
MRKLLIVLVGALVALPAAAQNVDIESLSGLQFNFGNPGARSLGMGGAFLGLADDASAAEANPAGLTILRKPEVTIEARNYVEQQVLTTSGVFPDLERTAFRNYSDRTVVSFASFVYPIKNKVTIGGYYHEPLRNTGGGQVFPTFNQFTGRVETTPPYFYVPAGGGEAISEAKCDEILQTNPAGCVRYDIDPFISALDVKERTYGLAAAWQVHPRFSVGVTARLQTFQEGAFTFRFSGYPDFIPKSISVQATAKENGDQVDIVTDKDFTFAGGFKWSPTDKVSIGGVYKQGAQFDAPTFVAGPETDFEYVLLAETKFHMPDSMGLGVSVRPIPTLTINADAVHVKYSNLVDDFVATISNVEDIGAPFVANDVTELHLGAEYFFTTKIPFALRAGYWRDPAHSVEWRGPVNRPDYIAEALLYPKGESQTHLSIGGGFAWPRFQIDFAYDTADAYKVGSISMVTRF